MARQQQVDHVDVLVVGAGFAGMYQLRKARELGLRVRVVERGRGPGDLVLESLSGGPGRR